LVKKYFVMFKQLKKIMGNFSLTLIVFIGARKNLFQCR